MVVIKKKMQTRTLGRTVEFQNEKIISKETKATVQTFVR